MKAGYVQKKQALTTKARSIKGSRLSLISFGLSQLLACQVWQGAVQEAVSFSPYEEAYFQACHPANGEGRLSWSQEGQPVVSKAQVDWLADASGDWRVQLLDPLGGMLLEMGWYPKSRSFIVAGSLRHKLPTLAVNKEGYLEANGWMLGLRAEELPCFFQAHFPRPWSAKLAWTSSQTAGGRVYETQEGKRRLGLRLSSRSQPQGAQACATLSWGAWFGWQTYELVWCVQPLSRLSRLSLADKYEILWEVDDSA